MKKAIKTVAGLLACVILASCSDNENLDMNGPFNPGDGDAASIVLKLSNEAVMKTKAFDDLQNDRTQNILSVKGNVNIFFFTATGNLIKSDTPSATDLISGKTYTNQNDNITTAVTEVVVIGNVGDISTGVSNKADLHAKMNTLENAQSAYMDASPDIWVFGSTTSIDWDETVVNGVKQGECSIDLAPILSRIDVTVNTSGITAGYDPADLSNSNIDFKGVAVLYSGGYTHYTPTFMPTLSELTNVYGSGVLPMKSGLVDDNYPLWNGSSSTSLLTAPAGDESILNASWSGQWNGKNNLDASAATFTRTFYAFPAMKETGYYNRNTILTVYGNYYAVPGNSANVVPLFWPVHFSSGQGLNGGTFSQPLENGNVYNLTINMKGDFSDGDSGTTDPDEETSPADIEVTITQVKWKAIITMEIDFSS